MNQIELLAPAGNMEAFKAAVVAGADAIYIGGKLFGARNYASNFTIEEMEEAITYAHLYDRKVYVTVNTIIYEAEVPSFLSYIESLVKIHVDALIIQDLGMADLLHQMYPTLELHASTQMHIHNLEGVKMIEQLGFKRAVIAREVDIDTIKQIKKETSLALEVFGHGALCVCYSGQCYMSYTIGGRSGNRGTCAQCCRQPYKVKCQNKTYNDGKYPLSMKDLNILPYISEFIEAGIDSIKIEGRMKRAEYVYMIVSLYRKAIDSYYQKGSFTLSLEDEKKLYKIFNRTFTKGFLFHENEKDIVHDYRPNHMGIVIGKVTQIMKNKIKILLKEDVSIGDGIRILNEKEDYGMTIASMCVQNRNVSSAHAKQEIELICNASISKNDLVIKTSDKKDLDEIHMQMKQQIKIPIMIKLQAYINKPLLLILEDGKNKVQVEGVIVEKAKASPISKETIEKQVTKLGDSPFIKKQVDIEAANSIFISIKEINSLRRKAVEELIRKRIWRYSVEKKSYQRIVPSFPQENKYAVKLSTLKQYEKIKNKSIDIIYAPASICESIEDKRLIESMPRVVKKYPYKINKKLITELGALYDSQDVDIDFSFNVTNSYTVALLHSLGAKRVILSYECNIHQVRKLIQNYKQRYKQNPYVGVMVYGREEVMIAKYDLLGKYKLKDGYLVDRFHNQYPLTRTNGYTVIYNYHKKEEKESDFFEIGVSFVLYHLTDE